MAPLSEKGENGGDFMSDFEKMKKGVDCTQGTGFILRLLKEVMIKMKTTREVCELIGITRRSLQEWDKIDLLHPTIRTKQGNMYDKAAINMLFIIKTFIEAGYTRGEIKKIIQSKDMDLFSEYRKIVDSLIEKRERINNMINYLKATMNGIESMPEEGLRALAKADVMNINMGMSFCEILTGGINTEIKNTEESDGIQELCTFISYRIMSIGCMKDKDPESEAVQEMVRQCVSMLGTKLFPIRFKENDDAKEDGDDHNDDGNAIDNNNYNKEDGDDDADASVSQAFTRAECAAMLIMMVESMLCNEDAKRILGGLVDSESGKYILKAITIFGEKQCKNGEIFENIVNEMKRRYETDGKL